MTIDEGLMGLPPGYSSLALQRRMEAPLVNHDVTCGWAGSWTCRSFAIRVLVEKNQGGAFILGTSAVSL